jgi:hypothetical protein
VDSLMSLRLSLNPQRRETLGFRDSAFAASREVRFSVMQNYKHTVIAYEHESLPINELMELYQLRNAVVNEQLTVYLFEELKVEYRVPPDPDEIFREIVRFTYFINQTTEEKILVGKLEPKIEVKMLNLQGSEEWKIKLKDFNLGILEETCIEFQSKLG